MNRVVGHIIDIRQRRIFPGSVSFANGKIHSIEPVENAPLHYILPGFIDAHVHIESSMIAPSEFARIAVTHGTVATISDPHEIANVVGMAGIRFMVHNGLQVPFYFYFGAPSCVPATHFETAGAEITAQDIQHLFEEDGLKYLSEVMNFPGVLNDDPVMMAKIAVAKAAKLPIDGHAPGLMGGQAKKYIEAGISTDHECYMLQEALDKLKGGMKILIREGSAAKNFEALHPIFASHPEMVMLCSDDKHPHELVQGHINQLVKRAVIDKGHDLFHVLHAACIAPIEHYKLDVGSLQPGDNADFTILEDLKEFNVLQSYIKGSLVAENGRSLIKSVPVECINNFHATMKTPQNFVAAGDETRIRVIEVVDGEIVTNAGFAHAKIKNGCILPDLQNDILKLAVINRYQEAPPAIAFVKNFGLKEGAIASSIAHDSHNIIAVGVDDECICRAVNAVIEQKGGISAVSCDKEWVLPLPLAGLMSPEDGWKVAEQYSAIDAKAKELGSKLQAPFMSLSFLALLVIPSLKLSDKGLFDVNLFNFTDLGHK
jgi:adenine deaminase